MNNTFKLFDITDLIKSFQSSTISNDCLSQFLNTYDFENVYETHDNSVVFEAGDDYQISIEFFYIDHPLMRKMSIMYWENFKPVILHF